MNVTREIASMSSFHILQVQPFFKHGKETEMRKLRVLCVGVMLLSCSLASLAEGPVKGENEFSLSASYSKLDFGVAAGYDLGSTTDSSVGLSYGWMLTDMHEVGFVVSYMKQEFEGGDFFESMDTDGTGFGGFYNLNVKTTGNITPYVGASVIKYGGDMGDAYDIQYGIDGGIKLYPFEHGGIVFSLNYAKLKADMDEMPDADAIGLGVGMILKY